MVTPVGSYSCVHCPLETIPYNTPCTLGYLGRGAFDPKDTKVGFGLFYTEQGVWDASSFDQ